MPQKALSKIKDRIENAQASIVVNDSREFNKLLLIEDALGSGATINEVAFKLKSKSLQRKFLGLL